MSSHESSRTTAKGELKKSIPGMIGSRGEARSRKNQVRISGTNGTTDSNLQ
jgi:hypothetical protein